MQCLTARGLRGLGNGLTTDSCLPSAMSDSEAMHITEEENVPKQSRSVRQTTSSASDGLADDWLMKIRIPCSAEKAGPR